MEILYGAERLTAVEVRERMADPPGYSAVRALLRILEEKARVRHEERGRGTGSLAARRSARR